MNRDGYWLGETRAHRCSCGHCIDARLAYQSGGLPGGSTWQQEQARVNLERSELLRGEAVTLRDEAARLLEDVTRQRAANEAWRSWAMPDAHPYPYGAPSPLCWQWSREMPWWAILLIPVAAAVAVILALGWAAALAVKAVRR